MPSTSGNIPVFLAAQTIRGGVPSVFEPLFSKSATSLHFHGPKTNRRLKHTSDSVTPHTPGRYTRGPCAFVARFVASPKPPPPLPAPVYPLRTATHPCSRRPARPCRPGPWHAPRAAPDAARLDVRTGARRRQRAPGAPRLLALPHQVGADAILQGGVLKGRPWTTRRCRQV